MSALTEPVGEGRVGGVSEAAAGRVIGRGVLMLVAAVIGVVLFVHLGPVLVRLFVAAIVAAAMTPPIDAAAAGLARWRWAPPRAAVAVALYLLVVLLAAALAARVFGPVVAETSTFVERLPDYAGEAADWYHRTLATPGPLRELLGGPDVGQPLGALAQQVPGVADQALALVQHIVGAAFGVLSAVTVFLLALYLTIDAPRIRDYLIVFVPAERRATVVRLSGEAAQRLGGWARGQVLLCATIGAMSWLGLTALGIPYALMLALVAAALEAVPTVGPILSAVPAASVALTVSPWHGAAALVLYFAIQQLEAYLIVPRVMSRAVSLSPLVVLVAMVAGAELLGPSGAVLAVPLAATLAVVVDEVRRGRLPPAKTAGRPEERAGEPDPPAGSDGRPPGRKPRIFPDPATAAASAREDRVGILGPRPTSTGRAR